MGIFGRRSQARHHASEDVEPVYGDADDLAAADAEDFDAEEDEVDEGPFDVAEAPDDGIPRLDLGSVRLPVPDGAQLQVEMDPEGAGLRAVHMLTPLGQFTVNAYAAPRSGGLWPEISVELAEQLRSDGAKVRQARGMWGEELSGTVNDVVLRFVGVDRPRWMLRGVVAGPPDGAEKAAVMLRELLRGTVVTRGDAPMPVRTPLPLELPEEIAAQVAAAQAQQAEQG
ncbi:MAG: DUF3710 domain-containing protein [Sciscionella sp.]